MIKNIADKNGFTLVEIIAVLLIASFLTALAGLGIVQLTKSYLMAKESSSISSEADFALIRIRKSVRNLVDIESASDSELEIVRVNNENIRITEKFKKEDKSLNLWVDGENFGPLAQGFENFKFSYNSGKKGQGNWDISKDDKKDLESVTAEIEYLNPFNTSLKFKDTILPRNTFYGSGLDEFTPSTPGDDEPDPPPGGGDDPTPGNPSCFISAGEFEKALSLIKNIKTNFLSNENFSTLILKKYSLICFFIFGIFLVMGKFIISFLNKKRKFSFANNNKGSILIAIIATIAVAGILGAGAIAFLTSGESQNVSRLFGQRAYYNAESGFRYALSAIMEEKDNDTAFAENIINKDKLFKTGDSEGFYLDFQSYYFRPFSGALVSVGNPPDSIKAGINISQGKFELKVKDKSKREIYSVKDINYDSGKITANDFPKNMDKDENAFIVISADEDKIVSEGGEIKIKGELKAFIPPFNGVVAINGHTLMYERFEGDTLKGLKALPLSGSQFPGSGVEINDDTDIVFRRYVKIVSTGVAGEGSFKEARVVLSRNQPLYSKDDFAILSEVFDGLKEYEKSQSVIGGHKLDKDTGILKVTETKGAPPKGKESLFEYNWSEEEKSFLEKMWKKSGNTLSYEGQVKIKFTEDEDDLTGEANYPGNYMPGISFRLRGESDYYGISFMRGVTGKTKGEDNDDIPDEFFYLDKKDKKNHQLTAGCVDPIYNMVSWDEDPPFDGIPYLVFWQKKGKKFDWLSYMPLVAAELCTIYQYSPKVVFDRTVLDSFELEPGNYVDFSSVTSLFFGGVILKEVQVPEGFKVTLYTQQNFKGEAVNFDQTRWFGLAGKYFASAKITYTGGFSYYDGEIPDSAHFDSFLAWKLTDKFNILKTHTIDGQDNILGLPGEIKVKKPNGSGMLVEDASYIVVPTDLNDQEKKKNYNYRLYMKPWVTLGFKIMEQEGDFNCDGKNEKINKVTAFIGSEDGFLKDGKTKRKKYLNNSENSEDYSVKWPSSGNYFTNAQWEGLGVKKDSDEPDFPTKGGYRFKKDKSIWGNIVAKDKDLNNKIVFSQTFLTPDINDKKPEKYFDDNPEIGLHTLGIDASEKLPEDKRETIYFKDFYFRFLQEGGSSIDLPSIVTE